MPLASAAVAAAGALLMVGRRAVDRAMSFARGVHRFFLRRPRPDRSGRKRGAKDQPRRRSKSRKRP